jgi:hypothetical protein
MIDDDPEGFFKMMDQIKINPGALATPAASGGGSSGGVGARPGGSITVTLSLKDQTVIANVRIRFTRMEKDDIVRGSNLVDSGR